MFFRNFLLLILASGIVLATPVPEMSQPSTRVFSFTDGTIFQITSPVYNAITIQVLKPGYTMVTGTSNGVMEPLLLITEAAKVEKGNN